MRASCAFHYYQRRPSSWCGLSRHEVWECLRLYFTVLSSSSDFSLSRHKIRVHATFLPPLPLSLHLRVSHPCTFPSLSWYVPSLISPAPPASFSGRDYADAIEAAPINVDMPPLGSVDKFSSRSLGRTSRGPPHDRILNRDDLDDAFECIPTGARLFIARRSYLVLELILGARVTWAIKSRIRCKGPPAYWHAYISIVYI